EHLFRHVHVTERAEVEGGESVETYRVDRVGERSAAVLRARGKTGRSDILYLILARTGDDERLLLAARCLRSTVHVGMIERDERDVRSEIHRFEMLRLFGYRAKDHRRVPRLGADARTFMECQYHGPQYSKEALLHTPQAALAVPARR